MMQSNRHPFIQPGNTPRIACLHALAEWESGQVRADDLLHRPGVCDGFAARDRALFTELFYGILRNLRALDFLIDHLRGGGLDPVTRNILRCGLYQLRWLRIPDHAAVNESVASAGRARGLVNALLRRSIREREDLDRLLAGASPGIRHSHPDFLVARWVARFGSTRAEAMLAEDNRPSELFVRVNLLLSTPEELIRAVPDAEPVAGRGDVFRVRHLPGDFLERGLGYMQDPATLAAVEMLDPQSGDTVLDACAAPGGKAAFIAQCMGDRGTLVATDCDPVRLGRLRENLTRLGVTIARVEAVDWVRGVASVGMFDRILLDAPCSNSGVLRRRVDARWRLVPDDFVRMAARQLRMLRHLIPCLKPGGRLVYSTCSIEPEENGEVVRALLSATPALRLEREHESIPGPGSHDGAYAAILSKDV